MASRAIPDKDRNTFFASYCKEGKNKVCVDCGAPNPQWATAYFGILFCLECSGQHRSLGTHLTFVRSITMDTWKEREIACMRAGGNDAMLAWWKAHDVSAKGSIRDKYNHPATQEYREKIKCLVEGRDYVEGALPAAAAAAKKSASSTSVTKKKTSSKSKSGSSKSKAAATPGPAVGQLFSFGDEDLKSSTASASSAADDASSDDDFESFVTPAPSRSVPTVPTYGRAGNEPNYSDPRLKQYEGRGGLGSDEFNRPPGAAAAPAEEADEDVIFSALTMGWSKITQVATDTTQKLAKSTAEIKEKVEGAQLGEKASSFIASLWSGQEPASKPSPPSSAKNPAGSGAPVTPDAAKPLPPALAPAPRSNVASPTPSDDGWGAWDGNEPAVAQSPGKSEDSWGAWGAWGSSAPQAAAAPAAPVATAPAAAKAADDSWGAWGAWGSSATPAPAAPAKSAAGSLLDLNFGAAPVTAAPVAEAQKDGWDDAAWNDFLKSK